MAEREDGTEGHEGKDKFHWLWSPCEGYVK